MSNIEQKTNPAAPPGSLRREFLKAGAGMGMLGLTSFPHLKAEVKPNADKQKAKSVIMIWLGGGPTQMETWDPKPAENRAQDYSRVKGHTTKTANPSAVSTTPAAAPAVIGQVTEAGDAGGSGDGGGGGGSGGGGGDGGGGEDGGGEGDSEPPTTAGPAPDGDGQHRRFKLFRLILLPLLALWAIVPSLRQIWYCLRFLFPDTVRRTVLRRELLWLQRHHRLARRKRLPFRIWMGFCLRLRTLMLFLRCGKEMLKEIGIDVKLTPKL